MEPIYKEESFRIVGAAIEVHRELGNGFQEPVYQESYELELATQSIPFVAQAPLRIHYKEHLLKKSYFADVLAYEKIIAELKVLPKLTSKEESQLLNYLKASKLKLGILINFGSPPPLEWKRIVN